jgi:formylglycine-generating enzyme required for sulfatase activity
VSEEATLDLPMQEAGDTFHSTMEGETIVRFAYVIDEVKKWGTCPVLKLDIGGGESMEFTRIPKGRFVMGSPWFELERRGDEPEHEVEITKEFYLGRYPVTQAQYKAVTGLNPSRFTGVGLPVKCESTGARLPVESLSWEDANRYCELLSVKLGRKASLPTEAQWEYACRAGTQTPFHFGSKLDGGLANCYRACPYGTDIRLPENEWMTTEVGSYPANPWGLYDMHGNVCQYCSDWYGPYALLTDNRDPVQHVRQPQTPDRVTRGGCWQSSAHACRSAFRGRFEARIDPTDLNGIRVCLPLDR